MLQVLTFTVVALVVVLVPSLAWATPISEKKERAREIRAQVAALDEKLEATIEQYNYANHQLLVVKQQIRRNTRALKVARYNLAVAHRNLNARAVALYKERPVDVFDVVFSAGSFEELASQLDLMKRLGEHDTAIIKSVEHYKKEIQDKRTKLLADRKKATELLGQIAAKKSAIESKLSERRAMLSGVEAEIRRMEAAEARAAAARAAAARAAATATATGSGSTAPAQRPIIPRSGGPGPS
jgi:peptidoglycan hydrolase CwlO-like protein